MQKIVYLPEPGFVYDLIQRFHVHYEYGGGQDEPADSHSTEIQSFFAAPPDDLQVFFEKNTAGAPMLLTRYFERYGDLLPTGQYDYAFFRRQLSVPGELPVSMTAHFFPRLSAREIEAALSDLRRITRLVRESDYGPEIQNRLLCFYIEPEYYSQLLLSELDVQAARLRAYYDRNSALIRHVRDTLSLDTLNEQLHSIPDLKDYLREEGAESGQESVAVAFTAVDQTVISCHRCENARFLLLGLNYQAYLEALARQSTRPDLYLFGKILSEPKRLKLIDTLLDGRAMRKDDICTLLNLSMTATHYHIDMMSRAWMLCCESRGRTFYYTLNRAYFDDVIKELQKYATPAPEAERKK